jgi:hypothetical protein
MRRSISTTFDTNSGVRCPRAFEVVPKKQTASATKAVSRERLFIFSPKGARIRAYTDETESRRAAEDVKSTSLILFESHASSVK